MKHAKIFSLLVFVSVLCYGAVGFYFLPLATFQGELARMGMLPETMFGWTQPQPAVSPDLMQQASWKDADILVVGDSFSETRVWQSALTKAGLRVRTLHWSMVRGICEDFMPWVRAQGFNGKYIVIEIVERHVVDQMNESIACRHLQLHSGVNTDTPPSPPIVSFDPHQGNYSGRVSIGLLTRLSAWKYERAASDPDFTGMELSNGVRLARVKNGCELFSHARCNDAIFLSEDRAAQDMPSSVLTDAKIINARLPGIVPIWVFVPDKSTSYLYPDKQFWNEAERRLHSPNLLQMTQHAIGNKVVDLYPANGSHFSTTGYLLMGDAILKAIQQQGR